MRLKMTKSDILRLHQTASETEYIPVDEITFDNDAGKAYKWQQLYFEAASIIESQNLHIETLRKLLEITK